MFFHFMEFLLFFTNASAAAPKAPAGSAAPWRCRAYAAVQACPFPLHLHCYDFCLEQEPKFLHDRTCTIEHTWNSAESSSVPFVMALPRRCQHLMRYHFGMPEQRRAS